MKFNDLESWLRWQETLHPREIELGLDRVRRVRERLAGLDGTAVVTVGGTNGKGSCVAVLEAAAAAAGHRVGAYTSPHLLRYNERVRIAGRLAGDDELMEAFQRVENARGRVSLTYFEFGTLAALDCFARARLDLVVLEVGLGGRLDAVNVVDADVAVVTSVDLDHQEWLGPDRDSIGREKAGIFRTGRPAVIGDRDPPAGLVEAARDAGALPRLIGRDFDFFPGNGSGTFEGSAWRVGPLPLARLPGVFADNAACALEALTLVPGLVRPDARSLACALGTLELPGRFQLVDGPVQWVLDVAHNPHGARALAAMLRQRPPAGRCIAVLGMLADKDAAGVAAALADVVDEWILADLGGARGRRSEVLAEAVGPMLPPGARVHGGEPPAALSLARDRAHPGDRVLVLGSFHLVGPALEFLGLYSPTVRREG